MNEVVEVAQQDWNTTFAKPTSSVTREDLFNLANNIPALLSHIKELEALLDHYRGTCDECGRMNVLLDFIPGYDGMERVCLLDTEGCKREHEAQVERSRLAAIKRRAETPNDPMWVMKDYYNREMLKLWRPK